MRTLTIIGAGQAGLCLAFGLLQDGHRVRLISNLTPEAIEGGPVTSSQSMYHRALSIERDLGLGFWDDECPPYETFAMTVADPQGNVLLGFRHGMDHPGLAVDQRLKMSRWLRHFKSSGGELIIGAATVDSLERHAQESDLVIVATGKGPISRLFTRDDSRSLFDKPPHGLALTYIKPDAERCAERLLSATITPGIGKLALFPGLTLSGPCEILTLMIDAGSPADRMEEARTPEEHLALTHEIANTWFPLDAKRLGRMELTDPKGVAVARFTPEVRRPVAHLPSGKPVMGIGDAVTLVDPMGGQGANLAARHAALVRERIRERGDGAFDQAWMEETFELHWEGAQWAVKLANGLVLPPTPSVGAALGLATSDPQFGRLLANSLDEPEGLNPWFYDPAKLEEILAARGPA